MKKMLVARKLRYADDCLFNIYAYEKVGDWLSLDPNSPYRGADGAMKIGSEICNDYNDDGKFEISQIRDSNGIETTINYIPPVSTRVEMKEDSLIIYQSEQLPGGAGTIEQRTAVPK